MGVSTGRRFRETQPCRREFLGVPPEKNDQDSRVGPFLDRDAVGVDSTRTKRRIAPVGPRGEGHRRVNPNDLPKLVILNTLSGMTTKIGVSLPDDMGERLRSLGSGQVSPYVQESILLRERCDAARAILTAAGHRAFPFDPEGAARRLASSTVTEEAYAEAVSRVAAVTHRSADDVRAQFAAARRSS